MRLFSIIFLFFGSIPSFSQLTGQATKESTSSFTIFEQIPSDQSKIYFRNDLQHDVSIKANLFDFDFFYNGAGVGVADINNDGLDDLFFCGNQVANKLYLNKGDLQFEDISDEAGINDGKQWSNGVTFADVNGDGWLDIYVSQGGPYQEEQRSNLLLINNKDLTFTESALEYGLNDQGLSTQSAFFDYDKDGDLDCFVMNENELYGVDPINFYRILESDNKLLYKNSSHFYKNENGKFVDNTQSAGLLRPSFGLGLVVSDLNDDGWLDVYMANDYYIPDALFINQKNGTFKDEIKQRTSQVSFYGMGVDIADFNNDRKQDIFVLDMASADHYRSKTLMASMNVDNFNMLVDDFKFAHQYMFNSLQLNLGNGQFRNIAHMLGVAKTDWSWAGLVTDFNNDSRKDIFVTNGYRRYALDNDFKNKVLEAKQEYKGQVPLEVKEALYEQMPTEKLSNLFYLNQGNLKFKEVSGQVGLGLPTYSNGAAFSDLDQDGDLELVVNNIDDEALVYKNLSREQQNGNYLAVKVKGRHSESFAKVTIKYAGQTQFAECKRVRGYFSAVSPVAHFGLGKVKRLDEVIVEWPNGLIQKKQKVKVNQTLFFDASKAQQDVHASGLEINNLLKEISIGQLKLFYRHQENDFNDFETEVLLPYKQSTLGPTIAKGDINNDGKEDLYLGSAAGQAASLFVNLGTEFTKVDIPAFEADKDYEDMEALFVDLDNDGDQDLYVISGGNSQAPDSKLYEDRIYINDGNLLHRNVNILNEENLYSGRSIDKIDFDQDGDWDLIIGNRIIPQHYPTAAPSVILENNDGVLKDVTEKVVPGLTELGIVNKVIVTDFNQDGLNDFIAIGEWTSIGLFENKGGTFENVASEYGIDGIRGWWFEIHEMDVNNDQLPDYIIGNVGLNTKFQANKGKPFKVFANDFDTNGTLDIVLSKKYKDEYVPVRGKECSTQQMPFISEKFETYDAFASATVFDIFEDKLDSALQLEANEFRSLVLINKGEQGFEIKYLPRIAQLFPILDCAEADLNKDGFKDLMVIGNIYNTEVETPRWDAGTGIAFLSDSSGHLSFEAKSIQNLYISGNAKSLEVVNMDNEKEYLIVAKNDDLLGLYLIK